MKSGLATWTIKVWGNYNDWTVGKTNIEKKAKEVVAFLRENGLQENEIVKTEVDKYDRYDTDEDIKKINTPTSTTNDINNTATATRSFLTLYFLFDILSPFLCLISPACHKPSP